MPFTLPVAWNMPWQPGAATVSSRLSYMVNLKTAKLSRYWFDWQACMTISSMTILRQTMTQLFAVTKLTVFNLLRGRIFSHVVQIVPVLGAPGFAVMRRCVRFLVCISCNFFENSLSYTSSCVLHFHGYWTVLTSCGWRSNQQTVTRKYFEYHA